MCDVDEAEFAEYLRYLEVARAQAPARASSDAPREPTGLGRGATPEPVVA